MCGKPVVNTRPWSCTRHYVPHYVMFDCLLAHYYILVVICHVSVDISVTSGMCTALVLIADNLRYD